MMVFRNQKHSAAKITQLFVANSPPGWPGIPGRGSLDYFGMGGRWRSHREFRSDRIIHPVSV